MTEQTFDRAASPALPLLDRHSPAVLLPLALVFGLAAQYLFYGAAVGVNLGIASAVLLAIAWRLRPSHARVDRLDGWIAPATLVVAFLPALRTDAMLLLFDVPATVVLVAMAAVSFAGVPVTRRALDILVVLGLVVAGRIIAGGAVLLAALPAVGRPLARHGGGRIVSVGIGLALALPFLAVFAALFASADAVFSKALRDLLDLNRWSIGELIGRALVATAFAWIAGGLFLVAARGADTGVEPVLPRLRGMVSSIASTTMLLAVDALFLFFVALQVTYLFGGLDTLNATGLTYSEYARRGFFELIAVAFVAGGLLFGIELVVANRPRVYVLAALVLAVATLVVVASAAYRMHLYQLAYGWTEQRFYALAGIVWLGAGALTAAILVWRGATRWLLHAAALLGLVVALAVHVVGPSGYVARANVQRVLDPSALPADAHRRLDAFYLVRLGDGAVPVLVEALPHLGSSDRQLLGSALRTFVFEGRDLGPGPWQAFSVERERARRALDGAADELRGYPLVRPGGTLVQQP